MMDVQAESWAGELHFALDPTAPGGVLQLSAVIVLVSRPTPAERGYASAQGSVLWEEQEAQPVVLEGGMTRFPIEVVAMAETDSGLAKAGWLLKLDRSALDVPPSMAVRLLVNEAHEQVLAAVAGDLSVESRLIRTAIRADVARQLIIGAVALDEFCEPSEPFKEESIGAALERLVAAFFPEETPSSIRAQVDPAPFQVEARSVSRSTFPVMKLFPRLPNTVARNLAEELQTLPVSELQERTTYRHPSAVFTAPAEQGPKSRVFETSGRHSLKLHTNSQIAGTGGRRSGLTPHAAKSSSSAWRSRQTRPPSPAFGLS